MDEMRATQAVIEIVENHGIAYLLHLVETALDVEEERAADLGLDEFAAMFSKYAERVSKMVDGLDGHGGYEDAINRASRAADLAREESEAELASLRAKLAEREAQVAQLRAAVAAETEHAIALTTGGAK